MRQVPKISVLIAILVAELGNNLLTPLFAFVFLATNSPLFTPEISMARRSILFGVSLSCYKLGEVLANIIFTSLSDYYGRKLALYSTSLGLLLIGILGGGALMIHSPLLMITGIFLANFLNTNKAIGPAIMGDIATDRQRVRYMALIQSIIAAGACLGPIIGGHLGEHPFWLPVAYLLPFAVVALLSVGNLYLVHSAPETLTCSSKPSKHYSLMTTFKDYLKLLQATQIRRLFLLLILCQISWSSYYEFIPPSLKNVFHYHPAKVGWFVGLIAFWLIIASSILIHGLVKVFNQRIILWLSAFGVALGSVMSLIATQYPSHPWSIPLMWGSAIPIAAGDVVFFSLFTALLSIHAPPEQQGKAMGLTLIIANLVWSLSALIGGYLLRYYPNRALLFAPVGAIALLLVLIYLPSPAPAQLKGEIA
ncbi:MAG: MFS transporter [Proteobacteria bacterium]|nr:MFS transporter [Pseudomonadota bacterium]